VFAATLVVAATFVGIGLDRNQHGILAFVTAGALAVVAALAAVGLERRLRAARAEALRDTLTGLPNRALLDDRIELALTRATRTGELFAVFVIDLDGFKEVNDVRGHDAGDQVLIEAARRLESTVRGIDTVGRVGGDEFVVLSLGTSAESEAALLVGRMRQALREPYELDVGSVEIDASIGWALFPVHGVTPVELFAHADSHMFATKRDTTDQKAVTRRASLHAGIVLELESALARDEVVVHYQPIVSLDSCVVCGAEALIRRVHPKRGLVLPAQFLRHIERTTLIRAITLHVVEDALRKADAWRRLGHRLDVHVNIPYHALQDRTLARDLARVVENAPTSMSVVTLEAIPPAVGAELDLSAVTTVLELGARLALDDVGNASSLAALRVLPLDEIKIDATFTRGLPDNERDVAIVRSLLGLARSLDMLVTAKSVETEAAWNSLSSLGCDRAQGFYVSPPLPPDEFEEWLRSTQLGVALAS
jgi:diguanylate cyclase (GGDEF)-like protein